MSERVRSHLRSNVVGYISLFCFAMSGTAMALDGTNTVFSDDIVNGEVSAADIGTGELTSGDILNGTIDQQDLANGAVGGANLITGSVSSPKVANDSLTNLDIANTNSLAPADIGELGDAELGPGSVSTDEISDSTFFAGDIVKAISFGDIEIPNNAIQSNEIQDGAVGAADLSVLTRKGPATTITDDGNLTVLQADCDAGEKALAGGAATGGALGVYMTQSAPIPNDVDGEDVPTGWAVTVENFSGSEQGGYGWAICAQAGVIGMKAGRN